MASDAASATADADAITVAATKAAAGLRAKERGDEITTAKKAVRASSKAAYPRQTRNKLAAQLRELSAQTEVFTKQADTARAHACRFEAEDDAALRTLVMAEATHRSDAGRNAHGPPPTPPDCAAAVPPDGPARSSAAALLWPPPVDLPATATPAPPRLLTRHTHGHRRRRLETQRHRPPVLHRV